MTNARKKKFFLNFIGLCFSVLPVLMAIISYFPEWRQRGGGTLFSGFVLLLVLLALIPLFNVIKSALKTPSAKTLWFVIFVVFFLLSRIADEMTVISFIGFVGNLIGAFFFKAAERAMKDGAKNEG
ncbi:MAG: hypothetical protein J6V09_03305 [Clostridia bacterium]|nr:hypothetical protein [Clostridia bacterium]